MTLSEEDVVCRFIRRKKGNWSNRDSRPTPQVFKQPGGLSVWHVELLRQNSVSLDDLRVCEFSGAGKAFHSVDDYFRLARRAAKEEDSPLEICVILRPEQAEGVWKKWSYAHCSVEILSGSEKVCTLFRQLLAQNARCSIPHDPL